MQSRYQVALLPTDITAKLGHVHDAENRAAALIKEAVQASSQFELTFLAQDRKHRKKIKKESNRTYKRLNKVWKSGKPRFDVVYRIGEQLGVDFAVMYQFEVPYGPDTMRVYLVNIKDRIEYQHSMLITGHFTRGHGYTAGLEVTKNILEDSLSDVRSSPRVGVDTGAEMR